MNSNVKKDSIQIILTKIVWILSKPRFFRADTHVRDAAGPSGKGNCKKQEETSDQTGAQKEIQVRD